MSEREKLELLEDMLELDEGTLTPDTVLDELGEWDSLSKLSLIVLMSDEYNKKITADDIRSFKTIGDILAFMG